MYSLSDIIHYSHPEYINYISRKTRFVTASRTSVYISFFWEHLIQECNVGKLLNNLNDGEKKAFYRLLTLYGYISIKDVDFYKYDFSALEKKCMWIFKYHNGDIFIPLEIFKTLMKDKALANHNYLFVLLHKFSLTLQHDFSVFLENSHGIYNLIAKEKNTLDMALVLYIWLLNLSKKNNIFPYSFLINKNIQVIHEATNMWQHLYKHHSHLTNVISEWYTIMKQSKKNIYHALLLVEGQKSELWELFAHAVYFPIFSKKNINVDTIQIITPTEVKSSIENSIFTFESKQYILPH